jgi:hypothetical protein
MMFQIPEQKCHRRILVHHKYFEMHDMYNLMEVIYNQNNMHLINIQRPNRIDMFEDCSMLPLIYNSIYNKIKILLFLMENPFTDFLHIEKNLFNKVQTLNSLLNCMLSKHVGDSAFGMSFLS